MLLQVIAQGSIESRDEVLSFPVSNLFSIADFQFVRPNILWSNDKTFFSGVEQNTFSNNTIKVFSYNHNTNSFYYQNVGNGTDVQDGFNHPQSYLWIEGSTIYVGQSNPHNGTIDLFRSDVSEDINGTWTELTVIPSGNAYPKIFTAVDGKVTISIRTGSNAPNFDLAVNRSNTSSIEGTFTFTKITANTNNNHRYYNQTPILYGTNTKNFIVGNVREETADPFTLYFAQCIFETTDFITYSNYLGTASKNVVSVAPFTPSEIDADYMLNGSLSADTEDFGFMNCIQIDDVFYGIALKSGTSQHYIFKINNGVLTSTLVNIPNLTRGNGLHEMYLYYNGNNILISCVIDDGGSFTREIWASPMDLSIFIQKYSYDMPSLSGPFRMVENLDKVIGEHIMIVELTYGNPNLAKFYLTNDKFFI